MIVFHISNPSLNTYGHLVTFSSKYRTVIMGIAMLSIMLFHQYFTNVFPFDVFHNFGYWGVDIFLFLSGMGLVKSLNNNSLKIYYVHRFKRIIPSCILCGSLKYIIFLLLGSSVAILKEGLHIGVWSIISFDLWFIPSIIFLYAISPILYRLLKEYSFLTLTIISLAFLINEVFIMPKVGVNWMSAIGIFSWTTERLPVFGAGMYIAMKEIYIDKKIRLSYLFIFLAIVFNILDKFGIVFQGIQAGEFYTLMLGMPALIEMIVTVLIKLPNKLIKIVSFFGTYSLELYLVHEFLFWSLYIKYASYNPFLMLLLSFILSCISAYLCKLLIEKIKTYVPKISYFVPKR